MIVYHGSNSNFKTLKISKSLTKHVSTLLNEGLGIYFTTDLSVAESYGKYLYILEINDAYFKDFRQAANCMAYLQRLRQLIYRQVRVDISKYIDLESIAANMYSGGLNLYCLGDRTIKLHLDSNENWYKLPEYKIDKVYRLLRQYDKTEAISYMFNYHIKNIGVIKKVNDDIVRIVGKEVFNNFLK